MRWDDDDDDDDDDDECKDREERREYRREKGEKSQDRIAIGGASACLPKDANERETHVRRHAAL